MKKLIAALLALVMVMALAACGNTENKETTPATTTEATEATTEATTGETAEVMTYNEYVEAEVDDAVVIEAYVQATQSWWDNKITVYAQDEDGAYFIYNMTCAEEDAADLTEGTKIRVTGYKANFEGEIEVAEGATFEFVEADPFVAEPVDVTRLLGADELIDYQNQKIAVKGATVKAIEFKNGEPGDDIYVTLTVDENDYDFCVEVYLTGAESEVYKTVSELEVGDQVNVEGFLYWYQGPNPHITAVEII